MVAKEQARPISTSFVPSYTEEAKKKPHFSLDEGIFSGEKGSYLSEVGTRFFAIIIRDHALKTENGLMSVDARRELEEETKAICRDAKFPFEREALDSLRTQFFGLVEQRDKQAGQ